MNPFKIHILGCGSATPTLRHNPSSQVVELNGKCFMADCGEGTQLALRRTHINFNKLGSVFISHLHGDHWLGLVGMISSFGLLGRSAPLHVYAPEELRRFLSPQKEFFTRHLDFEVVLHDVDPSRHETIYEDRSITVETIPLQHCVPCCGYLFREKQGRRHILRDMTDFYNIPVFRLNDIRDGSDWIDGDGNTIPNSILTTPPDPARSYAYCSDTRYFPELARQVKGVTVLYHESTYADDNIQKAQAYWHSTARQAAQTARDANAKLLLLGHYSQRYEDETVLLKEAQSVFENTQLTNEGMIIDVK